MTEDSYKYTAKMVSDVVAVLVKKAHMNKTDDGESSDNRRRWAIVHTDLEKVKAYIQTFLMEEDSEG